MKFLLASLLFAATQAQDAAPQQYLRGDHAEDDVLERELQGLIQYTPDQSNWTPIYDAVEAQRRVTDHSPDGIDWISDWSPWDGNVVDPNDFGGRIS